MGACESSPRARVAPSNNTKIEKNPKQAISRDEAIQKFVFENAISLSQGISKLPAVMHMSPIVVVKKTSYPIINTHLFHPRGDQTKIILPFATLSGYHRGRIITLSSIDIFTKCSEDINDSGAFMETFIQYVAGNVKGDYHILLLGFSKQNINRIVQAFRPFNFLIHTKIPSDLKKLRSYNAIISPIHTPYAEELISYVYRGGGLICGYVPEANLRTGENFELRSFLLEVGIGFPECSLQIGLSQSETIRMIPSEKNSATTLWQLIDNFIRHLNDKKRALTFEYLDSVVSALRYHVVVLPQEENPLLKELGDATLNYLEYISNFEEKELPLRENICPEIDQKILAVLLSDIFPRYPASAFKDFDMTDRYYFPGYYYIPSQSKYLSSKDAKEIISSNITTNFQFSCEFYCSSWLSTGVYLPAGFIGKIVLDFSKLRTNIPNECLSKLSFYVQVGSHPETLITNNRPWNRWFSVVTKFPIEINPESDFVSLDIGSPFGGIIYIVCAESFHLDLEGSDTILFDVSISNALKYPYYNINIDNYQEIFNASINLPIIPPFSEIETQFLTISLPTDQLLKIEDISAMSNWIDDIIKDLLQYIVDESEKLYRIVFDIDTTEMYPAPSYPITFPFSSMNNLLFKQGPSADLFTLLQLIAILSLPEGVFEPQYEQSLSLIAASHVFLSHFPSETINNYVFFAFPPAYYQTIDIFTRRPELFTETIDYIRNNIPIFPQPCETWKSFVIKLQELSGENLESKLIPIKKPGKKNVVSQFSSSSLHSYQLQNVE